MNYFTFLLLYRPRMNSFKWGKISSFGKYPTPLPGGGCDTRSIFKQSRIVLNSEIFFSKSSCLTKAKEPNLHNYLPIVEGRRKGFMLLQRALVQSETQTASSRIRTWAADSISYSNNCNTKCISLDLASVEHPVTNKFTIQFQWVYKASFLAIASQLDALINDHNCMSTLTQFEGRWCPHSIMVKVQDCSLK